MCEPGCGTSLCREPCLPVIHCPGDAAALGCPLSSEKLGWGPSGGCCRSLGQCWPRLTGGQGLVGTVRQVQRALPLGRVWGAVGPAQSHSSSTASLAQSPRTSQVEALQEPDCPPRSAVPGQPQPQLVQPLPPGSCGPRVLWSLPSRHWPWQETGHRPGQLLAEGGSLSSAAWMSACPPWSLGPLPGPTQWPLRAPATSATGEHRG